MKICFISPAVGTVVGGSETIVHQFAKHLSRRHDVTVLTGKSRHKPMLKEVLDAPYETLTVPYWPRYTFKNNLACKFIQRLNPYKAQSLSLYYNTLLRSKIKQRIKDMDIISTHYWMDSRLFSNLALKFGVPSVFHIVGGPHTKEYFEADKSVLYVAVSRGTQSLINETHDLNIEDVVTPGVPSHLFSDTEERKSQRKDERPSLLYLGQLQLSKGVFELIEMFRRLLKQYPDLRLTIVGDGDISDGLKQKIAEYNLQEKVVFTGSVSYNDVFRYYRSSTIFVFPTKREVFPLVSIEAMACGLPVVASDIPSLRESTGENAILLPPEDLDLWIDTLSRLLGDKDRRDELSEKGVEWAKKFTWEKKAQEYEMCLIKAKDMSNMGEIGYILSQQPI